MNIFVRIKDNKYDINGNHLYRVFVYHNFEENNQYYMVGKETLKRINIGRINTDNSFTTQWNKQEILNHLNKVFKNDNVFYVFE